MPVDLALLIEQKKQARAVQLALQVNLLAQGYALRLQRMGYMPQYAAQASAQFRAGLVAEIQGHLGLTPDR